MLSNLLQMSFRWSFIMYYDTASPFRKDEKSDKIGQI